MKILSSASKLAFGTLLGALCQTSALEAPVYIGEIAGDVRKIAVQGSYVFAAGGNEGMKIFDIRNPAEPKQVGIYNPGGGVERVAAAGSYVYVGVDRGYRSTPGVHVLDITDLTKPKRLSIYTMNATGDGGGGAANGFTLAGRYLYVTAELTNLAILDLSNPKALRRVGNYHGEGAGSDSIAVAGNHAFTERSGGGLQIIDISEPSKPQKVASYQLDGFSRGVAVAGHYAYVGDSFTGTFHVLDISNLAAPVEVGTYDTGVTIESVTVMGSYAFVCNRTQGLILLDVSDPSGPFLAASYVSSGAAMDAVIAGEYVYLADGLSLQILKFENPSAPVLQLGYEKGQAILSWPAVATGFLLERTSQLGTGAAWSPGGPASTINERFTVTAGANSGTEYFRLHKQ
jgi:hypothetical protein